MASTKQRLERKFHPIALALLAVFTLCLAGHNASLATIYSVEFKHRHDSSDLVAIIEVTSSQKIKTEWDTCGYRYEGKVVKPLRTAKGKHVRDNIVFGRHGSLKIGERYLLFLRWWDDSEAWLQDFYAQPANQRILIPSPKDGIELAECGGLMPGFQYDHIVAGHQVDAEFLFYGPATYYTLPEHVEARQASDYTVAIQADGLIRYLKSLGDPPVNESEWGITDTSPP